MAKLSKNLKFILDTNVVLDAMVAFLAPEKATVHQHINAHAMTVAFKNGSVYASDATLAELRHIAIDRIDSNNRFPEVSRKQRLGFIQQYSDMVTKRMAGHCFVPCRDVADQMLPDLAYGVGADVIISNDKDITALDGELDMRCLKPAQFLKGYGLLNKNTPAMLEPAPVRSMTVLPYFNVAADSKAGKIAQKQLRERWKPSTSQRKGVPAPAA